MLNMDSEEEVAVAVFVHILEKKEKRKKTKKTWYLVKPWLTRRDAVGFYNTIKLATLNTTLQRPINTFLTSKC